MKLLLDTHTFLWANIEAERLSLTVKSLLSSGEYELFLSVASPWEIQIKHQLGKLVLAKPVEELVNINRLENNTQLLPIELAHISYLAQLPQHHKDPFDRIIIAQAIIEDMTVVTVDKSFVDYPVQVIW